MTSPLALKLRALQPRTWLPIRLADPKTGQIYEIHADKRCYMKRNLKAPARRIHDKAMIADLLKQVQAKVIGNL